MLCFRVLYVILEDKMNANCLKLSIIFLGTRMVHAVTLIS